MDLAESSHGSFCTGVSPSPFRAVCRFLEDHEGLAEESTWVKLCAEFWVLRDSGAILSESPDPLSWRSKFARILFFPSKFPEVTQMQGASGDFS